MDDQLMSAAQHADAGIEMVRRHMALAEQRIGAAFVAEGLYIDLAGGVQGPHTLDLRHQVVPA